MNDADEQGALKASARPGGVETIQSLADLLFSLKQYDVGAVAGALKRLYEEDVETRPTFSSSWVSPLPPAEADLVHTYRVGDSEVRLYNLPERAESLYFVVPSEYQLPIHHLKLIHLARAELQRMPPGAVNLRRPAEIRAYVAQAGERLLYRIAKERDLRIGRDRSEEVQTTRRLAEVLAKYTAGLGIIELLLRDPTVQDVFVDAPASRTTVYVTIAPREGIHQRCVTNITLTEEDAEALLSRFRFESGRPFSEAIPVLETNLEAFRTRATVVGRPLSPAGLAIALRRHSPDPWTLPRLIRARSLSPLAAGLLSFLIDGRSTILVAGSRGAGKSSLLGALLFELPKSQRILTIEDTLELPGPQMRELGFKVQSLFVQSSLGGHGEMSAEEALRVSLRLGESAIVLGEVRGQEARTLYEAMRAGTAGSAVLGTIHGNSSTSVYERIVHDLGIPPMSFAATDIVVIAGLTRPGGSQRFSRRVTEVTELAKVRGPGEFEPLLAYRPETDSLEPTKVLQNSSERILAIARAWGLSYEEAIENVSGRAEIRSTLVDAAVLHRTGRFLTAPWVARTNAKYWSLVEEGFRGRELVEEWKAWFSKAT